MVKHRPKTGVLHHRVPDFQLVYCGSNKKLLGQVVKQVDRRRKLRAYVLANEKDRAVRRLKQDKRIGK